MVERGLATEKFQWGAQRTGAFLILLMVGRVRGHDFFKKDQTRDHQFHFFEYWVGLVFGIVIH